MASNPQPKSNYDLLNVPNEVPNEVPNVVPNVVLNDLFHVIFDTWTPRPHFIIKPKDPTAVDPDFAKMIEEQTQLQTLVKAVESMMVVMSGYEIHSGILSFHRGSWHSKDAKTFHAHICVRDIDVKLYEKVFEKYKGKIPESAWPNRRRGNVAEKRKVNNDPDSYLKNVRDYKINQMKKYFPNGKSKIEEPKTVLPTVGEEGITQVMHPSHPKIGFVGKRNEIEQEISLKAIEKFAQDLGLTNLENEYQGCHVCLYLGPVPEEEGWSQTGEDEEVLGYIVIDWRLFYQLCLEERRQNWFSAFKADSDFVCLT